MSKSKLNIIVVFISLSLLSLIAFQVYWMRSSYQMKQAQFDQDVKRALVNTVEANLKSQLVNADEFIFGAGANASQIHKNLYKDSIIQSVQIQISGNDFVEKTSIDSFKIKSIDVNKEWNSESVYKAEGYAMTSDTNSLDSVLSEMQSTIKIMFSSSEVEADYNFIDSTLAVEFKSFGLDGAYQFGVLSDDKDSLVYASSDNIDIDFLAGNDSYHSMLFLGRGSKKILSVYFPNRNTLILKRMLVLFVISVLLVLMIGGGFVYVLRIVMRQKKLSEMKNDFINNMTHELKTPIANIGLSLEALLNFGFIDDEQKRQQYIGIAQKENKRLSGLVEQVLNAAAFEKGVAEFKAEELDLHVLLEKAYQSFKLQIEDRNGIIDLHLNAKACLIMGDPSHINGVIFNLLDNANKYSPETPKISVSTRNTFNGIELTISDNGEGISKSNHGKIFSRFYRVNMGDLHNVKGYGLGLSYVQEVLQFHQASIKVESQLGKGSSFIIHFPFQTNLS